MSGKFLLDTNIVIALFAKDESILVQLQNADEVFIPSVVLGELYYGANKSSRAQANILRIDEFSAESQVLVSDAETARHYGEIKSALQAKGKLSPKTIFGSLHYLVNINIRWSRKISIFAK